LTSRGKSRPLKRTLHRTTSYFQADWTRV